MGDIVTDFASNVLYCFIDLHKLLEHKYQHQIA